jgi:hypothetical protein
MCDKADRDKRIKREKDKVNDRLYHIEKLIR